MPTDTGHIRAIERPGGRIAFEVIGTGPLIVLVPGMGDLRSTYRHLGPVLAAAGFRVATTDLRGHGDSDATFNSYGDPETAEDILALIEHLGGPAVVVGNSMGAGAAVIAAARSPQLVSALVLVGPFVRDPQVGWAKQALLRLAMARPWGARVWMSYLPKLYAGRRPADLQEHLAAVAASLRRPGYARAFNRTTRQTTHAPAREALPAVSAPTLVLMGALDPDFPDPAAEARWIAKALTARCVIIAEAGHYPQSQQPELTAREILGFLDRGDAIA